MERIIEDVYQGDDFYVRAEEASGFLFLHVDVYKNTPNSFRKMKKYLALFMGYVDLPVMTYTKNPKFVRMLGAKYLSEFIYDDELYEVWLWEQTR